MILGSFTRIGYKNLDLASVCAEHIIKAVSIGAGSGFSPFVLEELKRQFKSLLPKLDVANVALQKVLQTRLDYYVPSESLGEEVPQEIQDLRKLITNLRNLRLNLSL